MKCVVVVLDSDPDRVDQLTQRLNQEDYEVHKAFNTAQGVALASSQRPDVILVRYPLATEAAHLDLEDKRLRGVPQIFIADHADESASCNALALGATVLLPDSVGDALLLANINAIARSGQWLDDARRRSHSLNEARELSESTSMKKSHFLANLSHLARRSLTSIMGFAELLEDSSQPESVRLSCLKTIRKNGDRFLELVEDSFELARIETGKALVHKRCCPLTLIEDTVGEVREACAIEGVELSVQLRGPFPTTIESDARCCQKILSSILRRCIRTTVDKSVVLRASLNSVNPHGSQLGIEVSCMSPQLSNAVKSTLLTDLEAESEPGLDSSGLFLATRLAEVLHSDLEVQTTSDHRVRFSLQLDTGPLREGEFIAKPHVNLEAPTPLPEESTQFSGRVLLAEDGPDTKRLVTFLLGKVGLDVASVDDGRLAIDAVLEAERSGEGFDLVLMDMLMPDVDGYEATRTLRRQGVQTPIIALTTLAMDTDRQSCLEAGCNAFVTKPINRRLLLSTIRPFVTPVLTS